MRAPSTIGCFLLIIFTTIINQTMAGNNTNRLLYILLDGFRYDYVVDQTPNKIPGITQFIKEGVRAEWVNGVYPTLSYPSWTTLTTGQYPESHGIIGNYFYDAKDKDVFSLFDDDSTGKKKWWKNEPIWTTATKNSLRTAVYLWGRCDIPFDDIVPEICEPFKAIKGPEIFEENIKKAIKRFDEGFDLVGVYTEHVDGIGHAKGPDSDERKKAVRELDSTLVFLQEALQNLTDVNVIIVSDHGMADSSTKKVDLDDYIDPSLVENIADKGAFINVKVLEGNVDKVMTNLTKMPGADVYLKKDIPKELNYQKSEFIHEIIIKAKIGTWIRASKDNTKMLPNRNDKFIFNGGHGYDPKEMDMKSIFLAKGPDFKQNVKISAIDMVDVYPLLADLLNIEPNIHNGTLSHLDAGLVRYTGAASKGTVSVMMLISTFLLTILAH